MYPSPSGDRLGATAHVPASAWELMMLSTPQVGTAVPTAPTWEGCGGAPGWQPLFGFPHTCGTNLAGTGGLFNSPCSHPKESRHQHLNSLSEQERQEDSGAEAGHLPLLPSSYS